MRQIIYRASLALLAMLTLIAVPVRAGAQQLHSEPETITLLVDAVTPTGIKVTGSAVVVRHASDTGVTNDDFTFTGIVNGVQASVTGKGTERWLGTGQVEFTILNFTSWNAPMGHPAVPLTVMYVQTTDRLASISGVPVAMSHGLQPPGSGSASYTLTNAGTGTSQILTLPHTGAGPTLAHPATITALLLTIGLTFVAFGVFLTRRWNSGIKVQGQKVR